MEREKSPSGMEKGSIDAPEYLENAETNNSAPLSGLMEDYAAINKRLNRKFDYHILPFLFGIW